MPQLAHRGFHPYDPPHLVLAPWWVMTGRWRRCRVRGVGVRAGLAACAYVELAEDPGDVVLGGLLGDSTLVPGLTEMHNTFARCHALAEIAGEFGASVERLE